MAIGGVKLLQVPLVVAVPPDVLDVAFPIAVTDVMLTVVDRDARIALRCRSLTARKILALLRYDPVGVVNLLQVPLVVAVVPN